MHPDTIVPTTDLLPAVQPHCDVTLFSVKAELHKYYSLTSLPEEIFSKIWSLTNPTHEGVVGIQQFYLFMYFMTSAVKGENLPAAITEEDVARILGNRGQGSGEAPTMAAPAVAQGGSQSRDPKLQQLVELGFEEGAARSALEAAGNDVDAAANHLFGEPSPSGGQAEAPPPPASSPCSLRLVQVSSDVSKVAARVFLQVKVLGPGGSALEQNNMVEIVLGSGGRKETYARIDRTLKYEQSVDELLQSGAKLLFEIKKEKKRSFVGKAWGLLDHRAQVMLYTLLLQERYGVSKLAERQAIANKLSKAKREGRL